MINFRSHAIQSIKHLSFFSIHSLANLTKELKESPDGYDQNRLKSSIIDVIRAYTFFDEQDPSNDWSPLHWSDLEKKIVNKYKDKIPSVMRQVHV